MASWYSGGQKSNTQGGNSWYSSGGNSYGNSAEPEYQQLAIEKGYKPKRTFRSTLNRIFDILGAGETAPVVSKLISNRGRMSTPEALSTYWKSAKESVTGKVPFQEKKTYYDVLSQLGFKPKTKVGEYAKKGVGFLADVLLDPTTYVTFGAGSVPKIATKAGAKPLSKLGIKYLSETSKEVGEDVARKNLGELLMKPAGKQYQAFEGMKFAGVPVLPKAITDLPKKAITGLTPEFIKKPLRQAFKPFSEIDKMPYKFGGQGKYQDLFGLAQKGTRAEQDLRITDITNLAKQAKKVGGKNVGETLSQTFETGQKTGNKVLDNILSYAKKRHETILQAEKKRGLIQTELPNYLRHFLTPEGKEFLDKGGQQTLTEFAKPLRVKLGAAKPRKLEGTIKEINEKMKPLTGGKNIFEPNFFKALAGRESESIKATKMYDFFGEVGKQFGRPAQTFEKTLIHPVTGKTIKEAVTRPYMEEGVKFVESKVPQLKGTLVPEQIAKHLDETYQTLKSDEATNTFLKAYDKVLSIWKGSVTGWFPAFHGRNFVGGVFNNWLAGLKNPASYIQGAKISKGMDGKITTKLGKEYTFKEIKDLARMHGILGQPGQMDVMEWVGKEVDPTVIDTIKKAPQKVMQGVENIIRMPLFLDRIKKGFSPEDAAKDVFKFQFDYAPEALTSFEKNVMKRIMPFYRWTRGNIPMQLEQLVKQPRKAMAVGKATRGISEKIPDEEYENLPAYMKEALPMKLKGNEKEQGVAKYLYGFGLPIEDINRLMPEGSLWRMIEKEVLGGSPLISYPLQRMTGRHFSYGEPLEEQDYIYPVLGREIDKLPQPIQKWLDFSKKAKKDKQGNETKEFNYSMDPKKLLVLSTIAGRFYTTVGKAESEKSKKANLLNLLSGVKLRDVNLETQQYWNDKEKEQSVNDYLQKIGEIKKYENYYIPKDKKKSYF